MKTVSIAESGTRLKLANLISTLTNPCILGIVMLLAMAGTESLSLATAASAGALLVTFFAVVPLTYIHVRTLRLPEKHLYGLDPTLFLKRHPRDILILGAVLLPASWVSLKLLSAPASLLDTLTALLAVALIVALVNLFYRASFHLAAIVTLIYMAVVVWGPAFAGLALAAPFIAWSKRERHEHDIPQLVLGVCLAIAVVPVVLHGFRF